MNLTRCAQGHFYDGEKYPSCPHCAGAAGMVDTPTEMFTEGADLVTEANPTPAPQMTPQMTPQPAPQPAPQVTPQAVPGQVSTVDYQADDTLPIGGVSADSVTVPFTTDANIGKTIPLYDENSAPAADDDDDHTLAYFDYDEAAFGAPAAQPASPQPVNGPQSRQPFNGPCVGWLIAIGGNHIGQDFHLKVGKNFIGRDESMDIALTGDRSVSREKQAIIIYEPKQHLYLIQPGEASSLVYCNNEVVLNPVELKAYDMITVGEVNLVFMPLCGQQFNWNDILNHKKDNE